MPTLLAAGKLRRQARDDGAPVSRATAHLRRSPRGRPFLSCAVCRGGFLKEGLDFFLESVLVDHPDVKVPLRLFLVDDFASADGVGDLGKVAHVAGGVAVEDDQIGVEAFFDATLT